MSDPAGRSPVIQVVAEEEKRGQACGVLPELPPCFLVIFGATGDLAARKLFPALYHLFSLGGRPADFFIFGCGRSELTDEAFRKKVRESCLKGERGDEDTWRSFAGRLFYQRLDYHQPSGYEKLARLIEQRAQRRQMATNRLFYLAIPPTLYQVVALRLGEAGLARQGERGWARIVVEKPFGRDLESARQLDKTLHESFREEQIFRIDHYLAKETVQNILMFRFANAVFEPVWNRSYVDYVGVLAAEDLGVGHRAGYYEQAGVLRDMFQNHIMQLLALTALEPPSHFEAARVQDEKVKVFRSLKPLAQEHLSRDLILGQYGSGVVGGKKVAGYREEPGVAPDSKIPTFAAMRVFIDNWRWRGVPFYLVSGKRLARKETRIVIQFRQVPHSMFRDIIDEKILANRLVLGIYPEEEIRLTFQTKAPGVGTCLRPVTMDFKYGQGGGGVPLSAYEKVLIDCIQGDHMLFWRQDGVELTWAFLSPILAMCESCDELAPLPYPAGSYGPEPALSWVRLLTEVT